MNDDIETEEPFRAIYQQLLAKRRGLWARNRHVENAKKRKNDSFVGGTDAGREEALRRREAEEVPAATAPQKRRRGRPAGRRAA